MLHRDRPDEAKRPVSPLPGEPSMGLGAESLRECRRVKGHMKVLDLFCGGEAMGIDWLPWPALKESIPPAYTEWIGRAFTEYTSARAKIDG